MTTEAYQDQVAELVQGTGPYSVTNAYSQSTDLSVLIRTAAGALVTLPTADWSVLPEQSDTGGDVTLSTAAAALYDGDQLTVQRSTQIEQGWAGQGGSREDGLEAQLDRHARGLQDLQRANTLFIQMPADYAGAVPTFPLPETGRMPIWAADGSLENGPDAAEIADAGPNALLALQYRNEAEAFRNEAATFDPGDYVETNEVGTASAEDFTDDDDLAVDPGNVGSRGNMAAAIAAARPRLLASQDMTGQSDFMFSAFDPVLWLGYRFIFANFRGALRVQTSPDGVTPDAGATDYVFIREGANPQTNTGTSNVPVSSGLASTFQGEMTFFPSTGGYVPHFRSLMFGTNLAASDRCDTTWRRNSTAAVGGVYFSNGPFLQGHITVEGIPR